jgi:hypothetical protein
VEIVFIVSREKQLTIELPSSYAPWDSSQYVVMADLFEVVDYARAAREIVLIHTKEPGLARCFYLDSCLASSPNISSKTL